MDSVVMIPLKGLSIPQQKRVFDLLARQDLKKLLEIVSANLALELLHSIIQIARGQNENVQDPLYRQMLDNAVEFQLCSGAATQFITLARQDVVGHILDIKAYPTRSNRNWTRLEVKNVISGLFKYGKGKWQEISEEYLSSSYQTSVQVKDKYTSLIDLAKRGKARVNRDEVTPEMLVQFKIANALARPLSAGYAAPVIQASNAVELFLVGASLDPVLVRQVLLFMRRPEVHNFLLKGRSHYAIELIVGALTTLYEGRKLGAGY
ncbi:unnamed protein product [Linum trigynum]|uniref:Myb-like domain-containing protein n=1 Tax=Linum trigynum TaxID=586398 RepID=A0AAV2FQ87_9ROSI